MEISDFARKFGFDLSSETAKMLLTPQLKPFWNKILNLKTLQEINAKNYKIKDSEEIYALRQQQNSLKLKIKEVEARLDASGWNLRYKLHKKMQRNKEIEQKNAIIKNLRTEFETARDNFECFYQELPHIKEPVPIDFSEFEKELSEIPTIEEVTRQIQQEYDQIEQEINVFSMLECKAISFKIRELKKQNDIALQALEPEERERLLQDARQVMHDFVKNNKEAELEDENVIDPLELKFTENYSKIINLRNEFNVLAAKVIEKQTNEQEQYNLACSELKEIKQLLTEGEQLRLQWIKILQQFQEFPNADLKKTEYFENNDEFGYYWNYYPAFIKMREILELPPNATFREVSNVIEKMKNEHRLLESRINEAHQEIAAVNQAIELQNRRLSDIKAEAEAEDKETNEIYIPSQKRILGLAQDCIELCNELKIQKEFEYLETNVEIGSMPIKNILKGSPTK